MNRFLYHNILLFILILSASYLSAENNSIVKPWKADLQILLGFSDSSVDGIMGKETFEALKIFAIKHDLTDVVLRGKFDDLGFWGFQQYIMKYHQYWIRELKNHKIIDDVVNKEYIRQADETLYSFEISIQNAQLEVERLIHAKSKAKRVAKEKQMMQEWQQEKNEVERIIASLNNAIITAEKESEKWSLERIRAQRLAEEQEQLARLDQRKLEASILTEDLEDAIRVAKKEIDRLVEENKKLKNLIITTTNTKQIADEMKTELQAARVQLDSLYTRQIKHELKEELEATRMQIDSLSIQKNSLEKKLAEIELTIVEKDPTLEKKKKWYKKVWPFGKD